ncbi:MAG: hypothetical protein D6820_11220 [Lentisphaerae bacterium]|nr:MAG: hypothetical protein D6820_11220 [Lentisphaerota bacterium]
MGHLQEKIAQLEDRYILGEVLEEDYRRQKREYLEELLLNGELLTNTGLVKVAEIRDARDVPFCYVPEGGFFAGDDNHWEELKCGFYISKYPVLVKEFREFLSEVDIGYTDEDYERLALVAPEDECPASHLSYNDAKEFCRWLRRETGEYYSLPHELEWEKAARGEDGRIYPWGHEEVTSEHACFQNDIEYNCTVPVTLFEEKNVSPFGCVDMVGNVWEWCLDSFDDPRDPHILRGGSWCNTFEYINNLARTFAFPPDKRLDYGGFRIIYLPSDLLADYRRAYSDQGKKTYGCLKVVRIDRGGQAKSDQVEKRPRMKQLSQIFDKAAAKAAQSSQEREMDKPTPAAGGEGVSATDTELNDALAQAINEAANLLLRKNTNENVAVPVEGSETSTVVKALGNLRRVGEDDSSGSKSGVKFRSIAELREERKKHSSESNLQVARLEFDEDARIQIDRAEAFKVSKGLTYFMFGVWFVLLISVILVVISHFLGL